MARNKQNKIKSKGLKDLRKYFTHNTTKKSTTAAGGVKNPHRLGP
jgi:hypothetical protein